MLFASYFFYAVWDVRFLFLLFGISLFNFIISFLIGRSPIAKKKKFFLGTAISGNLLTLGFFKYYDFFRTSLEFLFDSAGLPTGLPFLTVILPVGLSFYILRAISYNIDIFRGKIEPCQSFLDFSIYIAFFPQLLSGPIARANDFLPQLEKSGAKKIENSAEYFSLIIGGLFKKLVISSYLTVALVDKVLAVPQNHSNWMVLLAVYGYALVIYCDFSGYSDLAIGVAGLMGFKSPANFNTPYLALNLQDFWRRWHITLSNWFKDYLYIPLGGNRNGKLRKYINLMVTMIVCGLWHGAGLTYLVWGGLHGLGLTATHFFKNIFYSKENVASAKNNEKKEGDKVIKNFILWLLTFNFICLGWIFFRAESLANALDVLKALFVRQGLKGIIFEPYLWFILALGFLVLFFEKRATLFFSVFQQKMHFIWQALLIALIIIIILKLGPDIVPPFVYFKF